MRPPFNSFQSQARPPQRHQHQHQQQQQQQQQHQPQHQHQHQHQHQQNNGYSNHHQHNGYQNPVNPNQLGMMNPQMMSNPMMNHMNNPIPMLNMPIHPQFNNFPNMPPQQQQPHQFDINQLLPSLLGNLQYANNNFMGHSLPLVQPNFFQPSPAFTSQPQLNSFNPLSYPPVPTPHQNQQLQPPGPPGFSEPQPQGQSVQSGNNTNGSGSKGNGFRNNFTKHQKLKGPGQGFQRSQLNQADNAKRKCGFKKDHMGKGNYNKMANGLDGSDACNIAKEKKSKRSIPWFYTPKEIKQWREARRKNFPTELNVEKKLNKNVSGGILDEEAKLRRQQLKEVLAKQAELGCEVAEVPSYYLVNTEEQVNGDRGDNKKGRFQNKRRKKPRLQDSSSMTTTRKPTLLEKLLSGDIKRDKSQLLQVFRFMVMNSFFKDLPEQQSLQLPLVMVEETGCEHDREDDVVVDDDDDDDDMDDNSCDEEIV